MISLANITLQRGRDALIKDSTLTIYDGHKVAVIGRNGCGKSSLFELILGNLTTDKGEANIPSKSRISHMAQEVSGSDRTALDFVLDGHKEYRVIQQAIEAANASEQYEKLGQLYTDLESIDGYNAEHTAAELLYGLGFNHHQHDNPVNTFSGGWRIRLNLAQALMMPSDIMLLDEPTNHLDMDTTYWLERRLKLYKGTLLLISHDRDFIDNVVLEIVHIEHNQLNLYKGNYSGFEKQRAERLALQQANYVKQQQKMAHLQQFIDRFKAKATKAKQAQSRVKQLGNMQLVAQAQVDSPFHFQFLDGGKMSDPLLNLIDVNLGYTETNILKKVCLNLHPGDRIGLLGKNGAGKSTLIKSLTNELKPQAGSLNKGEHCTIGYFAQHQLEALDNQASCLLHIQRMSPKSSEQEIRNFLGGFNFHGDKALEPITPFSGGEKARLALALVVWQKPNVLLLDEPTNHLDLEMRSALTLALQQFSGALIIVSHDRHLLRHSVDRFLLVSDGAVNEFSGTLDDYHNWLENSQSAKPLAKKKTHAVNVKKISGQASQQIKKLEKQLVHLSKKLKKLELELAEQPLYAPDQKEQLNKKLEEKYLIESNIEDTELQWFELQE